MSERGYIYTTKQRLVTETCCNCGVLFAMTEEIYDRRQSDGKWFYCPNGHSQYYGKTDKQRFEEEKAKMQRRIEAAEGRARRKEAEAIRASKSLSKMRTRVKNGVCPCCNRSFENLQRHMATKHPEFGTGEAVAMLRSALAMTQAELSEEIGVNPAQISAYENGRHISTTAKERIEVWLAGSDNP